jgi:hypothetical protein
MRASPIFHDVKGAPFRIGDRVLIVGSKDETFNPTYLGLVGTVKYLEYNCGCGQTYPEDPMIGIQFDYATSEEFWKDEMSQCPSLFNPEAKKSIQPVSAAAQKLNHLKIAKNL